MSRKFVIAIGLLGLCGGCGLMTADSGPSEAEQRQNAILKDPMGANMDPPRSVSDGNIGKDFNDFFFP
jgi:hypothetical protein